MFKPPLHKGFTLVEMIVSLAIFSVVALVSVGALVKVMDANKKSINLKTAINNLNFALESMSREMRMGSNYYCTRVSGSSGNILGGMNAHGEDCPDGLRDNWMIVFESSERNSSNSCNLIIAYKFEDNILSKAEQALDDQNCNVLQYTDFYPLISPDIVKITTSVVSVSNMNSNKQPMIRFYLDGETGVKDRNKTRFSLQTTISQRPSK